MPKKASKSEKEYNEDNATIKKQKSKAKISTSQLQTKKPKQSWNFRLYILLLIIIILTIATVYYSYFTGYIPLGYEYESPPPEPSPPAPEPSGPDFLRGDANRDTVVDNADPTYINNYLQGGPALGCKKAADANDDGTVNTADSQYILDFKFSGGPAPPAPYPERGQDQTADGLDCAAYPTDNPQEALQGSEGSEVFDLDGDGVDIFENDNCPVHANPRQEDFDNDKVGNVCDGCPLGQANRDFDSFCDDIDPNPKITMGEEYTSIFIRGDPDGSGGVNSKDPTFLITYLTKGGAAPKCQDAADANDDGEIDISDVTYINSFLAKTGPAPPAPYPARGVDATPTDSLGCAYYPPEQGTLKVTSTQGATVKYKHTHIDKIFTLPTSTSATTSKSVKTEEGTYTIAISKSGYKTYTTEVNVIGGKTATVSYSLVKV